MICLPNMKRAFATSSIRDRVRNRTRAPLMIIASPGRRSRTNPVMRASRSVRAISGLASAEGIIHWLLEQVQQRGRRLVGDRKRLRAKLLTDLQGLKLRRFLRQIRIHQRAEAGLQRVDLIAVLAYL